MNYIIYHLIDGRVLTIQQYHAECLDEVRHAQEIAMFDILGDDSL